MPDTRPSAEGAGTTVLARIIAAHRRKAAAARDRSPVLSAGYERALRHAAVPFKGLELLPQEVEVREHVDLSTARSDLPQDGLIAVLEDGGGARGLIALCHGAVDALVEVQTTGRVDPRELPPRPVTRIDEALCRDFIDLCLAAFSRETRGVEDRDWPERMSFGSRIADPGQLGLLLPEWTYHVLTAAIALGEDGARRARVTLVLPRTRDPVPRAVAASGTMDPDTWRKALEEAMAEARIDLDAVLVRTTRSLRDLEALGPGDLIGFEPSDLASVRLETAAGKPVLRGRLGQIAGQRALRMTAGSGGLMPPVGAALDGPPGIAATRPSHLDALPGTLPGPAPMSMEDTGTPIAPDPGAPPDPVHGAGAPAAPPHEFAPQTAPMDFAPQTASLDPDALLP
jgi:flagellar motor switch protein FliM